MNVTWKNDCIHFIGDRPCGLAPECSGCRHYRTADSRVLVIKLGALGDVLRTTSILTGIKRAASNSHITWVTDSECVPLFSGNKLVDRVLALSPETMLQLSLEEFDFLYSFDKDKRAISLASLVKAKKKYGFGMDRFGHPFPLNRSSNYAFLLGISDNLKMKVNRKTYPEMIYEMAGLEYRKDKYILTLSSKEIEYGKKFISSLGITGKKRIIGLNTGCGPRFATKKWPDDHFVSLTEMLLAQTGFAVLLLGGPREKKSHQKIMDRFKGKIFTSGYRHSLREFASIVGECDTIVTADTLTMHLAIALSRNVIALFGPTSAAEIELYGKGEKIISSLDCVPCYKNVCRKKVRCMDTIEPETVLEKIIKS